MSKVYRCGDFHGGLDHAKLSSRFFPEGNMLTKDDYVIILGDFWSAQGKQSTKNDAYWVNWLNEKPWTTIVILGNHDNWPAVRSDYPEVEFLGAKMYQVASSLYVVERGEIFYINGKSHFAFGGGFSIDVYNRTPGISWWQDELPTLKECTYALQKLESVGNKVDYIYTHDLPYSAAYDDFHLSLKKNNMNLYPSKYVDIQTFLDIIKEDVEFTEWCCGHYHFDQTVGKFKVHYYYITKEE